MRHEEPNGHERRGVDGSNRVPHPIQIVREVLIHHPQLCRGVRHVVALPIGGGDCPAGERQRGNIGLKVLFVEEGVREHGVQRCAMRYERSGEVRPEPSGRLDGARREDVDVCLLEV
jgi:hypothetical protein